MESFARFMFFFSVWEGGGLKTLKCEMIRDIHHRCEVVENDAQKPNVGVFLIFRCERTGKISFFSQLTSFTKNHEKSHNQSPSPFSGRLNDSQLASYVPTKTPLHSLVFVDFRTWPFF